VAYIRVDERHPASLGGETNVFEHRPTGITNAWDRVPRAPGRAAGRQAGGSVAANNPCDDSTGRGELTSWEGISLPPIIVIPIGTRGRAAALLGEGSSDAAD